jgi:phosphoglycolate phosphatase
MGDVEKRKTGMHAKSIAVREIFFDFEGTVVDFQWQLKPAVEECLAELEKAGFNRDWYGTNPSYAYLYNHTLSLARQGRGSGDPSSAIAVIDEVYDKYDADALTRWNLYPDTLMVIEKLREQGFLMGIISNIGSVSLSAAMDKLGLAGKVEVVISRSDVTELKPHPEGLIKAAEQLKVDPAQSIFIGDSRNDVGAARGAGMLAGFIRGGEDSPDAMARHPADIEIDRLSQLPSSLFRIAP